MALAQAGEIVDGFDRALGAVQHEDDGEDAEGHARRRRSR